MTPADYATQIRSLRAALDHLRALDLAELAAEAVIQGSAADRDLIDALRKSLPGLPEGHARRMPDTL